MNRKPVFAFAILFLLLQSPGFGQAKLPKFDHTAFAVKLLTPVSTKGSQEGDTFTCLVIEPAEISGAEVSGKITKLKAPKKGKGNAEISFEFKSVSFKGESRDILAELKDVSNSQGVKSVDEEGHVISKTSKKKSAVAALTGAGLGALLGGIAGGGKGAAIGAAAGGAAGLIIGIKMTASASNIEFFPGSQFSLDVSDAQEDQKGNEMPRPSR